MKTKTRTLSLAAVILFLFVILVKVVISIYSTDVIIENVIKLESFYGGEIDVVKYLYDNYISLIKIDTIGLSIALLCGCCLISFSFYLKLQNARIISKTYKKIFTTMFSIANGLCLLTSMFTLFSDYIIFYTLTMVFLLFILILVIVDAIATFISNDKNIIKSVRMVILTLSLCAAGVGVFFHFNDITTHLNNNEKMIELHYQVSEDYYSSIYEDQEMIDNEVEKYMHAIKEFHSNKGYLVGMNNISMEGYTYILKRDNVISFTTSLTTDQKALYNTFTEPLSLNIPLLISLLGVVIVLMIGLSFSDDEKSKGEIIVEEYLTRIETYQARVKAGTMSEQEYMELKQILYSQIKK